MFLDSIHEECGVFGIYESKTANVAKSTYFALYALQHRGQESCGIAVNDGPLEEMGYPTKKGPP